MNLSKDSLRILKLASKLETISFDDVCLSVTDSIHSKYAAEHLDELDKKGLLFVTSERMPEGYHTRAFDCCYHFVCNQHHMANAVIITETTDNTKAITLSQKHTELNFTSRLPSAVRWAVLYFAI